MAVIEFDHVGVVVQDLEATAQFFVDLRFRREDRVEVSGEWVDRVVGLKGVRAELVVVSAPDGSGALELTAFSQPTRRHEDTELPANAHGYRHLAYRVTSVNDVVAQAREAGYESVGDIVDYQGTYRLAYIRGPEGLILEVTEALSPVSDG